MIKSFSVSICYRNNFCLVARNPSFRQLVSAMAASKAVVEYAKSGRSTCKECTETIASKSVRLGLVSKDPRGYDATKWHHLNCFPINSDGVGSAEAIEGFSLLKDDDQEAVKKLLDGKSQSREEVQEVDKGGNDDPVVKKKKRKVREGDEGEDVAKKAKKSTEPEVVVEYAKSGRSSCKKCMKSIATKTLRLGLAAWDPRGYNATKWYHSDCYPLDSVLIASVEEIHGFSSLESNDQEALKKLLNGNPNGGVKVTENDEIDKDDLAENNSKQTKVQEMDEGVNNDLGVKEKKRKVSERDEGEKVDKKAKKSTEPEVIVEYAKSGRSSCKTCTESIAAKALRLGLVSWDPRGYSATKWYHSNCYPLDSASIASVEKINGFSSLESNDQKALKTLLDGNPNCGEKVAEKDQIDKADLEDKNLKQAKLLTPGRAKLEISFSVTDISDKYKDAKLSPKWKAFQTVIFREKDDDLHDSSKIAAFDFDGCLANTDVRRTGADAWSLMYPSIPEKLQSLYKEGYKLVIFTNESNIDRWKNKRQEAVDSKIGRLDKFIDLVKVPIQVFIACGVGKSGGKAEDLFRKPNLGMWYLMEQHLNSGIAIDMNKSFYVGDAAGREKDHSDADLKFAQAIGLKFHLPEDYF